MRVDYYLSLMSPYAYLAGAELERIADRHGVGVAYKPVDILAIFEATGATPPSRRHPSRQAYRLQDLARCAELGGLPIHLKPAHFPVDTGPAAAAVIAAQSAGLGAGHLAQAFLRAVWAEERDIADPAVVAAILEAQGVTEDLLAPYRAEAAGGLARNTAEALEKGVFGAPFYVVGEALFWGQDRLPHLDAHLAALRESGVLEEPA